MCAQVCTHSDILGPVLSDAHRERQIHSEKQIVPLLWVWSGHREKGSSEKTKAKPSERKREKVPTSASKSEARYNVCPLFLFHHLSVLAFLVYTWAVSTFLPLPCALICMPFHGKTSPRLTVEMNCSITECTYNSEFNSSLLRKDLALESIYPWENPRTQLQLALKHT